VIPYSQSTKSLFTRSHAESSLFKRYTTVPRTNGTNSKEPGCACPESGCATGPRPCIQIIAAPAIAVARIITTSVHSAVDKLGEIDDEVLVLARSKREIKEDSLAVFINSCKANARQ
jgi:hypothetical protein